MGMSLAEMQQYYAESNFIISAACFVPGICYVLAAISAAFIDYKHLLTTAVILTVAVPVISSLLIAGAWMFLAVIIVGALASMFIPEVAALLAVCAPGLGVALLLAAAGAVFAIMGNLFLPF